MPTVGTMGHVTSFPQWGDVPTWVLAALALAALIAAVLAYRKQAEAASKLSDQVGIQSEQLKDQQAANRKQAEVVDAQLREVQQRAEAFERRQADQIALTPRTISGASAGVLTPESAESVHVAVITNGSNRPVRSVSCKIEASPVGVSTVHDRVAARIGEFVDMRLGSGALAEQFVPGENTDRMSVLRSGQRGAFVFPFSTDRYPRPRFTVQFTDDADLHWQIDHDLHLVKLDSRDDW